MNKNYTLLSVIILSLFSIILGEKVLATVGGPTYISQIAYNASSDSVYYIENDYSDSGCPPVIHSINLAKNQNVPVKTCDEALREFFRGYGEEREQKYEQFISDFYRNLSYIGSVSLKKNNIDVRIDVRAEVLSAYIADDGEKLWTEFRAVLTQHNKEVAKIDFLGCDKEQPHIFEGYRIPNTDAMAILISNKDGCLEGGYVGETLHLVRGVKYYDTNIIRGFKEASATEPNSGNMIVYAASKDVVSNNIDTSTNTPPTQSTPPNQQTQQKNLVPISILLGVAIFMAGILLGYLIGKRSIRFVGKNLPNSSQ